MLAVWSCALRALRPRRTLAEILDEAVSDVAAAGFEVAEAVIEMPVYPACLAAVVLFAAAGRAALDLRSPRLQA